MEQFEIIVVDDGSTDQTAQRVEKYGSQNPIFSASRTGDQASALNFGYCKSSGRDRCACWMPMISGLPGKLKRDRGRISESVPEAGMVYHRLLELNSETSEQKEGESSRALRLSAG